MRMQIDDVSDEHQLAQVKRSLQDEFRAVTPEDLDRVADTAYRRRKRRDRANVLADSRRA